jgi:hypothetical protein
MTLAPPCLSLDKNTNISAKMSVFLSNSACRSSAECEMENGGKIWKLEIGIWNLEMGEGIVES